MANDDRDDVAETDSNYSPQFHSEVAKLKERITNHIKNNQLRQTFMHYSTDILTPDPLLCTYFVILIRKMEEKEKQTLIKEVIKTIHEYTDLHEAQNIHISNIYESIVDSLLINALHEDVLTIAQCIEGLVMTTDFTMRSRIDQRKWEYIRKSIPKIDYKGIRNVLRYLLESQLRRLPSTLTPEQLAELRIVEDIILYIMDRDVNLLPPLITLSEIMRGIWKQTHMMPRLASKLSQIAIHFRPIADLTHICGRSFIYPIPQHPCFVPYASFWETEFSSSTPFVQSHHMLPYRPEHTTTFLYTLYMILRQPRGKDSFNPQHKSKTKSHWDVLLSVMICEAMAEAESLGENDPIPRYQWDNIVNIVNFGIYQQMLNPAHFFSVLRGLVKTTHYTRARDEVMWIVFQIVGSFSTTSTFDEAIPEIVELYKVLFAGEVVWMGASDHPALLARFLAAASTWMMLEGKEKLPSPNETVQSHITFITEAAENFDGKNTAMIAVLANAYRSDSKVGKMIPQIYQQHLEGTPEDAPVMSLSYGRQAVNRMTAFSVEFLDALTFRAKNALFKQCFNLLRNFHSDKLPSPAVFDTMARICQAVDYDQAAKEVVAMSHRSLNAIMLHEAPVLAKDQCFFLFDFLCYRLPSLAMSGRQACITSILNVLNTPVINCQANHQLYQLLEQYLMRQWCWATFHDTIATANGLFGTTTTRNPNAIAVIRSLQTPATFSPHLDGRTFPFCPEIFKMSVITLMRALKISGQDVVLENSMFPSLLTGFLWPEKMTSYFPQWAQDVISDHRDHSQSLQPNFEDVQHSVRMALNLHPSMTPQQFAMSYVHPGESATSNTILAVIYKYLYDNADANLAITPEFYDIALKKTPKDMVIAANFLVDYLISETKNQPENDQLASTMAKILSQMVFRWNFVRADRLLISLVMHPTCDETTKITMNIVHEFCVSPEFLERVKWFNQHVPRKENAHAEYIRKVVEYHELYPEHEVIEMLKGPQHDALSNIHMPTYYGCLIERLMPIADFILSVTLEQNICPTVQHSPYLNSLALLYKYHPTPIQFMYSILFTMHGQIKKQVARAFVLTLKQQIEEAHFTHSFEKFNHQNVTKEQLVMELLDRIATSLDFILGPPTFVAKDWKTAEFSPGAQTLFLATIEIMASPYSQETLVPAMINVLVTKPHSRPYNVVNLISLLLSALPADYSQALHTEFFEVLTSGTTEEMTFEELVFDNFEESQLLHLANRAQVVNVISQAYWTHCNVCLLSTFAKKHVPDLMERVKTEKDLWYTLRLVVPLIRRFLEWQTETSKRTRYESGNFGPLMILKQIFERIAIMSENGVEFVYEHHLCDLFYNCKYAFAGDFLRDSAIQEFAKLPERMRDRLKFYVSQSEPTPKKEEKKVQQQDLPAAQPVQPIQQQQEMVEDPIIQQQQQVQQIQQVVEDVEMMDQQQQHQQHQQHQPMMMQQQHLQQTMMQPMMQQMPQQQQPMMQYQMDQHHQMQMQHQQQHYQQHQMDFQQHQHQQMHLQHQQPAAYPMGMQMGWPQQQQMPQQIQQQPPMMQHQMMIQPGQPNPYAMHPQGGGQF